MKKLLLFLSITLNLTCVEPAISDWEKCQAEVLLHQNSIHGWCTSAKAKSMMDLIYDVKPEICAEVGVFAGSSIYPTATALKFLQKGQVYAIDPWEVTFCLEGYAQDDPHYLWWEQVDLNWIYLNFLKLLNQFHLTSYCRVIRTTGLQALDLFADQSIDILHIDGNHTENIAISDVELYFPKVKKGGYIWLDDVDWPSVSRAIEFLSSNCEKIESFSTTNYFLFKKK